MRTAFLIAGLSLMSLMFGFGGFCAAAPRRARREFGGAASPFNNSGDLQIRLCGVLFMVAAVFFASLLYRANFGL
jgi:hypothetical protein